MFGEVIERRLDGSRIRVRAHLQGNCATDRACKVYYSAEICGKGKRKWVDIIDTNSYTYRRSEFPRSDLDYNCALAVAGSVNLEKAFKDLMLKLVGNINPNLTDLREVDEPGEEYFKSIMEKYV